MARHCCCNFICAALVLYGLSSVTDYLPRVLQTRVDIFNRLYMGPRWLLAWYSQSTFKLLMWCMLLGSLILIWQCDGEPPDHGGVWYILILSPYIFLGLALSTVVCLIWYRSFVSGNFTCDILLNPFSAPDDLFTEHVHSLTQGAAPTFDKQQGVTSKPVEAVAPTAVRSLTDDADIQGFSKFWRQFDVDCIESSR